VNDLLSPEAKLVLADLLEDRARATGFKGETDPADFFPLPCHPAVPLDDLGHVTPLLLRIVVRVVSETHPYLRRLSG